MLKPPAWLPLAGAARRELYADYLAAVAQAWHEIRAAIIDSEQPWPERARVANLAYRNSRVYELRYQISITAPPDIRKLVSGAARLPGLKLASAAPTLVKPIE